MYVILSHSLVREVLTQNSPLKKISKLNTWTITLLVKNMNIPSERINFPAVQYDENRLNITPYCYVHIPIVRILPYVTLFTKAI